METTQTAVEWFYQRILAKDIKEVYEQAKQMEIDRRKQDFKIAYNHGYLDARCNHINDADNLANEIEYLQSQVDNINAEIKRRENKIADLLINGSNK